MRGGRIYSDASVFSDFDAFVMDITNDAGSVAQGDGDDHALDNLRVAIADPQLDQAFPTPTLPTGATAELNFTITNTADLASKLGWSFTGDLPAG